MANDYGKKTNAELIEILKSRGLAHTGKKADLVARLQEDDSKKAAAPAKTDIADDVIDWEDDEAPAAAKPADAAAAAIPTETPTTEAPQTEEPTAEPKGAAPSQEEGSEGTVAAAPEPTSQAEEKPAPNYSIGLPITELEEELKKRKARAEKFGITEDSQAAIAEAEKKLERAKRFGAGVEESDAGNGVSRLDHALPDEKSRKRGRGDNNEQGARGGKRRNFNGRNNFKQRGRGNRNQGQGQGQGQGQKRGGNANKSFSEKDKLAMEARKKRFAAGA